MDTAPAGTSAGASAESADAQRPGHLRIANRWIGPGEPAYVIAEIGPNHNGDLAIAKQLVDVAVAAGADAAKFQKRKLSEVYQERILANPREGEQGIQYLVPLLIEFELSDDQFVELRDYCTLQGITFLCTPWDHHSVDFLDAMGVPAFKIGSPDLTNVPLIEHVLSKDKPLLISTGMATEAEIKFTLDLLRQRSARAAVFHCVSTYPVSNDEINLRFMNTLREWSRFPVGYSGHDRGLAVSIAAIGMGASLLEKHITLDRTMRGPDHKASLEPDEFISLVRSVRDVEAALGGTQRWITRGEVLNRRALAKSLVATRDLATGDLVTRDVVTSKSPGMGLSPQRIGDLVGRRLSRPVRRDDVFVDADVEEQQGAHEERAINIGLPWGIIARFGDMGPLVERFAGKGMSLIEFHVSDRDLDAGLESYPGTSYPYDLVIHAPEYCHDRLIDLCASDESQRRMSVARIQKTIDLARDLSKFFSGVSSAGPKVVIHVGGMWPTPGAYDMAKATEALQQSVSELRMEGVQLLLENLPPYPWYFGGRWFGHVLTDAETTARLCEATGLGLCFDTSHAALECHRTGASLVDFARTVLPHVRHLHLSDGAGVSGEGLQVGDGHVEFVDLLPLLEGTGATCVPEIWMGHHEVGTGFQVALERLSEVRWAGLALRRSSAVANRKRLSGALLPAGSSLGAALSRIEANHLGTSIVADADGRVVGVITDGDVRRALLAGRGLDATVDDAMTRTFVFATHGVSPTDIARLLSARTRVVPILDADRHLVDIASVFPSTDSA